MTLTLLAQSFGRQVYLDADEYRTLAAMGMTRTQLVATAAIHAAVISAFGTGLAVVVAILASPRMPMASRARPRSTPGVSVDAVVFVAGVVITVRDAHGLDRTGRVAIDAVPGTSRGVKPPTDATRRASPAC